MTEITIALCQMNVVDNKEKNIEKAIEMINNAIAKNADFIVLPEMFNCPYENEKFIEYCENGKKSETVAKISEMARLNNVYILAGSISEQENSNIYNTSYFFNRNGEMIAKHRKMHLFDIDVKDKIYFKESDTLTAGNEITVAETDFGKIGIGICYDIRFPELARLMVNEGAEILFYPGAFNLTTGPAHWELLFRARALDNQVYCVGVAPALDKEANYNSYGHSIITNPWGEVVVEGDYGEELIIGKIDLDEIKRIREELPLLKNKRNDIYKLDKI
ncbi:MAG: carbon-nitrogen hydrolase family protein [Methanobrevibacter sp.]|uniref:carbon-nitrogen hydrolase family protein n=1 Tax=Methanobrevibacter sp. TaxID=66852 RepID=UPI0026DF2A4D|nr:carbon-nitrogen hydrolase family protein [Methanobrevibacter sp.]MDO5848961.1 carbon-nitrogen hydrolase family protein [Methanobrevibacter sp.]